jgi:hypothetical protein
VAPVLVLLLASAGPGAALTWNFTDVTLAAGFNYSHGVNGGLNSDARYHCGGVAAGDYDNDGWVDLYVVRGNVGANLLFRNKGDGTFQEVGAAAGVNITNVLGAGPTFADYDGDGWLDLFVGGVETANETLFRNLGNGTFQNVTAASGITYPYDTMSASFADYDRDGDIDLFLTHWGAPQFAGGHLWRNNGNGTFTDVDVPAEFGEFGDDIFERTFTANWADVDSDGWLDVLIASDYGNSEIYHNDGDGTFTCITSAVITDQFGMGASVSDYDNDGDLDWFVDSIWDAPAGVPRTGNRMYRNAGDGTFTDVTDQAGVRAGYWGWGASFADFNNDGHLDLFQVNGMRAPFDIDPSRMWISNGDLTFTERSVELGVADTKQGRGVVCFDYDKDGDLDIFVANNSQPPILYRNDGGNALRHLKVRLVGEAPNTEAIGARVYVTAGSMTQMRELRCGNNYVSQDPVEAHFGLGTATVTDTIRIVWPSGQTDVLQGIPSNITLVVNESGITSVAPGVVAEAASSATTVEQAGHAPNPTSAGATIRYSVRGGAGIVRAEIFDATGRVVRTLRNGPQSGGSYSLAWDGRDGANAPVPAGIYFYRVSAAGGGAGGKIAVVR